MITAARRLSLPLVLVVQFSQRTSSTAVKFPDTFRTPHLCASIYNTNIRYSSTFFCFPVTLTCPDVSHAPVACRARPCLDLPNPRPSTDKYNH